MMTRIGRFLSAGLAGFVVQIAVLAMLIALDVQYLVATALAVELAIVVNFLWHERWTWQDRPARNDRERWLRLVRYNAMTGVTSIVGSLVVTGLLVESLSMSPVVANIISVVALGALNFAGAETLVFRAGVGGDGACARRAGAGVGRGEAPAENGGGVREVRRRR